MSDVKDFVQAFNLRLTMDRDCNVANLERQLALVRSENNEQRFRRIGIEWTLSMFGFKEAVVAAKKAYDRYENAHAHTLTICPDRVTRLEIRCGEELGKPGTVRIDVSQPYPLPTFEAYIPAEWFLETWKEIGGCL